MLDSKSILLVNDLPGFGKVALGAMIPILSAQGHLISNLPTALVSNTLDFGIFEIQDTTAYIEKTLEVWKQLDLHFDYLCTGFLCNDRQADLLINYKQEHPDTFLLVDPVMGDEGKLYNGVPVETILSMRKLAHYADLLVPNATEASLLVHGQAPTVEKTKDYYFDLLHELHTLGAKSIIITSVICNGQYTILGYDDQKKYFFEIPYKNIPIKLPGTGDIFTAVTLDNIIRMKSLEEAVKASALKLYAMINRVQNSVNRNFGLPIEDLLFML